MPDYDLKGAQASSIYQLGESIGTVRLEGEWYDFRAEARKICDHFLTLSAASLLADLKIAFFFQNLCRCAENWRRFLVSSRDYFNRHVPLTYNAPLYAAIITNEKTILQGIVDALPSDWLEGEEYEDRFHICKLHGLLAVNGCRLDDNALYHLNRLAQADPNPLDVDLFQALLEMDGRKEKDFWLAFESASHQHEALIDKRVKSVTTQISQFIAHRFIWFEGLAWLHLAMRKGFTLPTISILYCPDEVLENMREPFAGDWLLVPIPEQA